MCPGGDLVAIVVGGPDAGACAGRDQVDEALLHGGAELPGQGAEGAASCAPEPGDQIYPWGVSGRVMCRR